AVRCERAAWLVPCRWYTPRFAERSTLRRKQMTRAVRLAGAGLFVSVLLCGTVTAQAISPELYSGLRWRLLGPFRAGRVTAVAGTPDDPAVYYFATPNGGVWKTTDAGRVWRPIFDGQRVASIGALAVATSNSKIVYV